MRSGKQDVLLSMPYLCKIRIILSLSVTERLQLELMSSAKIWHTEQRFFHSELMLLETYGWGSPGRLWGILYFRCDCITENKFSVCFNRTFCSNKWQASLGSVTILKGFMKTLHMSRETLTNLYQIPEAMLVLALRKYFKVFLHKNEKCFCWLVLWIEGSSHLTYIIQSSKWIEENTFHIRCFCLNGNEIN